MLEARNRYLCLEVRDETFPPVMIEGVASYARPAAILSEDATCDLPLLGYLQRSRATHATILRLHSILHARSYSKGFPILLSGDRIILNTTNHRCNYADHSNRSNLGKWCPHPLRWRRSNRPRLPTAGERLR